MGGGGSNEAISTREKTYRERHDTRERQEKLLPAAVKDGHGMIRGNEKNKKNTTTRAGESNEGDDLHTACTMAAITWQGMHRIGRVSTLMAAQICHTSSKFELG